MKNKNGGNRGKLSNVNKKKLLICIGLIVIVIYAIYITIKLIKNPTDTVLIEKGEIYLEESTSGYIIRDETVIDGQNYGNGIIQIKSEGEKVAKGEAIFRYPADNEEELKNTIRELDETIQKALTNETTIFSSDIKLLDSQIEEKLNTIYELNNMQEIAEYKKNINTYITKKAKVAGNLSSSGSYMKQLVTKRNELENQLSRNSEYINSNRSGIVSYRVDGLETTLTTTDFSYLNSNFLKDLNLRTGQLISESGEKGKIIDNFKCYIAISSNSQEAKNANVGNTIKLRLANSQLVSAKIVHILDEGEQRLLVFEVEDGIQELIKYRKVSIDVIWWSNDGLKVPNSAIEYEGDVAYLIRVRAGKEEKILVKVLRQNSKYSIIDNYSSSELKELNYDISNATIKKSVSLYDEIKILQ